MKKKLLLLLLSIFMMTGCLKRDSMEDIDIYTGVYPLKYIVDYLYGDNAKIYSIYPNNVNVDEYKLTDKQITDYSKSALLVFNSLDVDRDYAVEMINKNKKLKIIDVALGMEYEHEIEELWLNPYNYLMMAQNVKTGLYEYITNPYLLKEIDEKYEDLKMKLSTLDALIKTAVNESNYNTIIVDNDLFKFLEKYNLNVISLEETDNLTNKDIEDTKRLIKSGKIKYIYTKDENTNETVKEILNTTKAELVHLNAMRTVDGGVTNSNENYISIMNDNIDLIKKELYKWFYKVPF